MRTRNNRIARIRARIAALGRAMKERNSERGTTFVEILVTMAIIAILMSTVTIAVITYIPQANIAKAKSDISTLRMAITSYYLEAYDYPDPSTWQQDIKKYMTDGKVPKDPWSMDYVYTKPGPEEDIPYELRSGGPNKTQGDDDDIVSWKLSDSKQDAEENTDNQ